MSTNLTRMFSEHWFYKVLNNNLFDYDVYIQRSIYRDFDYLQKSWSWNGKYKLEIHQTNYDKEGVKVSNDLLFECSNFTKETLSRKFKEFQIEGGLQLQLIKKEQFFSTK